MSTQFKFDASTACMFVKCLLRGFLKLKKIQKFVKKLGSGWVGEAPTRICLFFIKLVFFCVVFFEKKKIG